MALYQLMYISHARDDISDKDIADIVDVAQRHNAPQEISGVLLYHDKAFLQVLEGERGRVMDLYDRIQLDPRHSGSFIVTEAEIDHRTYGQWAMGLVVPPVGLDGAEGVFEIFSDQANELIYADAPRRVRSFIKAYIATQVK